MSTKLEKLQKEIEVPENVKASLKGRMLAIEGPLGKTHKSFRKIPIDIAVDGGRITLKAQGARKKDYAVLNTAGSIIKNLCAGVVDGYTIKMKVVFAHFPITVKVQNDKVLIENFQGERSARTAKIAGKTKVEPKGEDVIVTGHVLTDVTQTAANIQLRTKIKNKDHRVFLDGIYVYEKTSGIKK